MLKNRFEEVAGKVIDQSSQEKAYEKDLEKKAGIYMFISIDLVNSTIFKTRYTEYWSFVIKSFYKIVTTVLGAEDSYRGVDSVRYIGKKEKYDSEKMKTDGFKVWKLVGDEVLLYHKIVSISEVLNTVRIVNYITRNIRELFVTNGKNHYEEDQVEFEKFSRIARMHLMAKTTIWCAKCGDEISYNWPNMFYDASNYLETSENCLDFLGPDIDAGFRLCGYAEKNKVIISPDLLALLSVQKESQEETELTGEIENCYRIVTYAALEAVWDKRKYPIFLYCPYNSEKEKNERWTELFEYDEIEESRLSSYINADERFYENKEYSFEKLDRIYKQLGRKEEIDDLKRYFKEQIVNLQNVKNLVRTDKHKFEFHISCACYNDKEDKIWIEKHKIHGLSFGCHRIAENHEYKDEMIKYYEEKNKVNICSLDENDLLSMYSLCRNNGKEEILGVILFANARPVQGIKSTQENGWYRLSSVESLMKDKKNKKIKEFDYVIQKIKEKKENVN